MGQYQVWVDNNTEGWSLNDFSTLEEVEDFILKGRPYGRDFVVTETLQMELIFRPREVKEK